MPTRADATPAMIHRTPTGVSIVNACRPGLIDPEREGRRHAEGDRPRRRTQPDAQCQERWPPRMRRCAGLSGRRCRGRGRRPGSWSGARSRVIPVTPRSTWPAIRVDGPDEQRCGHEMMTRAWMKDSRSSGIPVWTCISPPPVRNAPNRSAARTMPSGLCPASRPGRCAEPDAAGQVVRHPGRPSRDSNTAQTRRTMVMPGSSSRRRLCPHSAPP